MGSKQSSEFENLEMTLYPCAVDRTPMSWACCIESQCWRLTWNDLGVQPLIVTEIIEVGVKYLIISRLGEPCSFGLIAVRTGGDEI